VGLLFGFLSFLSLSLFFFLYILYGWFVNYSTEAKRENKLALPQQTRSGEGGVGSPRERVPIPTVLYKL